MQLVHYKDSDICNTDLIPFTVSLVTDLIYSLLCNQDRKLTGNLNIKVPETPCTHAFTLDHSEHMWTQPSFAITNVKKSYGKLSIWCFLGFKLQCGKLFTPAPVSLTVAAHRASSQATHSALHWNHTTPLLLRLLLLIPVSDERGRNHPETTGSRLDSHYENWNSFGKKHPALHKNSICKTYIINLQMRLIENVMQPLS